MTSVLGSAPSSLGAPAFDPLGRALLGNPPAGAPPVVVAIHGRAASTAALRVGAALARRDGEPLEVLTVEERLTSGAKGFCLDAPALESDAVRRSGVLATIRTQLLDTLGHEDWRLHVEFGRVAPSIARAASEMHARIIVLGIGCARPAERLFGRETAARVLRYATVPVLAAHPSTTGLPHRAAVAVDFSEQSLRAAHATAALLEPPAVLYLVHVSSITSPDFPEDAAWTMVFEAGVRATFERLRQELARPGVTVEPRLLTGPVAETIATFAREQRIELLAAGSHGHEIVDRLLLGSVPAQLLRGAECSVLVAPPQAAD